ncbi:4Fe-4S dicluster domain-containing protein [Mycolicibacterium chitae]|uniref:4Fe-4S dicluster domain-containing protein n=1 Tax=Mycolicibacterium chitae TaxID=1792 RepID=UPI001F16B990|nr:ferredoxin family protein [Mycolicibacterium chitae]
MGDYSCLEVCPAGCIHPTPDDPDFARAEQLYINPESCLECGACVDACPVDAVYDESRLPARWSAYTGFNRDYFEAANHE